LAYVHLHRTVWSIQPWEDGPFLGSLAFGVVITAAYLARGVAHGVVARSVVARLHPAAGAPPPLPVFALISASAIGAGGVILGGLCGGIPGLFIAGWFADLPGVLAVEEGGVWRALTRSRPRGAVFKATRGVVMTLGIGALVWFNLVAGANAAVVILRALTGADTGALALAVAPTNGGFLAAAAVLSFLIVEPLWVVLRGLLYLDARLGRSGVDLGDRWEALKIARAAVEPTQRPRRRPGASVTGVLAALWLGTTASFGAAQEQEAPVELTIEMHEVLENRVDGSVPSPYAARVGSARVALEEAIERYDTSGWEDLDEIRSEAEGALLDAVPLPGGARLEVDGRVLVDDLPDQIHSSFTRERAMRAAELLADAEAGARALTRASTADGPSPRDLLARILADGEYDVRVETGDQDARRQGFQERLARWWRSFLDSFDGAPAPQTTPRVSPNLSGFDLRWIPATLAILGVAAVLLMLGIRLGDRPRRPGLGESAEDPRGGSSLPDARTRTPVGWREHARGLRAEGRLRDAVRAQYLGVLAALDRRREIDYRPERTNGALIASFRGVQARRRPFEEATRRFEVVWYGEHGVEERDLDAMEATCVALTGREDPDG
jgi:hypothetical protein